MWVQELIVPLPRNIAGSPFINPPVTMLVRRYAVVFDNLQRIASRSEKSRREVRLSY